MSSSLEKLSYVLLIVKSTTDISFAGLETLLSPPPYFLKESKEASGDAATHRPGYLGSQDTYFVGIIKGMGPIYQQTFIDTFSRVAFVKLFDHKNALVAIDLLNDCVLPFFEVHEVKLLRMLTDRGAEFCGRTKLHKFEQYLTTKNIEHIKTQASSPQANSICAFFHKTIVEEFYSIAFRKNTYHSMEELQKDVDQWLNYYNKHRPHREHYCYGKTPYQTFIDKMPWLQQNRSASSPPQPALLKMCP